MEQSWGLWLQALNYLPSYNVVLLCEILIKMKAKDVKMLTENLAQKVLALQNSDMILWRSLVEQEQKFILKNNA